MKMLLSQVSKELYVFFCVCFFNQEVEREISFRTESGLYYSYYKQLVNAPSLGQGKQSFFHNILAIF